jgi:hypothetical protein
MGKLNDFLATAWDGATSKRATATASQGFQGIKTLVRCSVIKHMVMHELLSHRPASCCAGPCGSIVQPTFSDHAGQQQCPAATTADGTFRLLEFQHTPTGYLSVNANESMPDSIWTHRELYPMNGSYIFKVNTQHAHTHTTRLVRVFRCFVEAHSTTTDYPGHECADSFPFQHGV